MATSKPISTISYNSIEFLEDKLNTLVECGKVSAWIYINHIGEMIEDDEAMGKDHKHLLIIPNKCVDMMEVQKCFIEFLPYDPRHPLKCMPFRTAKVSDWILYALHDPDYLDIKGLRKSYHYDLPDLVSNDRDYLNVLYVEAKQTLKTNPVIKMRRAARSGVGFGDLVRSGAVSIQQVNNARMYFDYLVHDDELNESKTARGVLVFDDNCCIMGDGSIKWADSSGAFGDELP